MNLDLPAGCEVREIETRVEAAPGAGVDAPGFVEHTTIEVLARGGCASVHVALPPGVRLGAHQAKLRFGDDTSRKLDDTRWRHSPRGLDDVGGVTLLVPELLGGDRVFLSFERLWPRTGFVWAPDAVGAKVALFDGHGLPAGWALAGGQSAPAADRLRMVYLPVIPGAAPAAKVNPAVVAVSAPDALAVTLTAGALPGDDPAAWQDALAARWVSFPRGVDGTTPLGGDAALARGGGDDRGFARTLVARAAGSGADVSLAWAFPEGATPVRGGGAPPGAVVEIAVWTTAQGRVALLPPGLDAPAALWAGEPLGPVTERPVAPTAPGAPPRIRRVTTFDIPGRDPQIALFPGGKASAAVVETLEFDADDHARAWFVPGATGPDAGRDRGDGVVLVIPPGEEPTSRTLTWTIADPPTCGLAANPGATRFEAIFVDEQGRVRTEGDGWWLAEHGGFPIMPDVERVARGLNRRFNAASLPEPGIPLEARGLTGSDPDAVAQLLALLRQQVRVAPLANDPELPRRLVVARREGVATPLEAALFLRAWGGQIGLRATWALARPASDGPPLAICPGTFPVALAVVDVGDSPLVIDPTCTVCAVGELPPSLEGAAVFGPVGSPGPAVRPGALKVVDRRDGDRVRREVHLEGTAALQLRLELAALPEPARIPALAARWAGPGGAVEALEGFGDLGRPITIRIVGDALPAPFDAPRDTPAGPWWAWVGPRQWDNADNATEIVRVDAHLAR